MVAPNSGPRPVVGNMLVVIHDFVARSSDELTLARGDRVKLLEGDDEFGDGWYLGKHLVNGNSGLFPQVYTRLAPNGVATTNTASAPRPAPATQSSQPTLATLAEAPSPQEEPQQLISIPQLIQETPRPVESPIATPAKPIEDRIAAVPPPPITTDVRKTVSTPALNPLISPTSPTSTATPTQRAVSSSTIIPENGASQFQDTNQNSGVLNDTLNVIDEHIDNLRSGPSNSRATNDSGSEYSSHAENRLSYIQGEETDEEDGGQLTRAEVERWTPDHVAEHLFTSGVEKQHCEVFRDQEITGDVLLGMDQSSLFIKAFDLGSVGRRLKTWHKIKQVQDEVNGVSFFSTRRTTQTYGSETGSEDVRSVGRSRTGTVTSSIRPPPPIGLQPESQQSSRLSMTSSNARTDASQAMTSPLTSSFSPKSTVDSPTRPLHQHQSRPSAASVRDLHHSRRFSSQDYRLTGTTLSAAPTPKTATSGTFPVAETSSSHKKQPSFDRNWTLGGARPLSSTGLKQVITQSTNPDDSSSSIAATTDVDRGYYSSVEGDGKKRNTLRKRDSAATHSRNTSYTEEQRKRSATALARHSRFGSVGSTRPGSVSAAQQQYYGATGASNPHRRTLSTNTADQMRPIFTSQESGSPTVTKLDPAIMSPSQASPMSPSSQAGNRLSMTLGLKPGSVGYRATSDAVTGQERKAIAVDSPLRDSPIQSPSIGGSSSPSQGPSLEIDSPDVSAKSPDMQGLAPRPTVKRKGKKETSAYTRGLLKRSPREAMQDADYSGWMKKKSSALMTTWKPRLFVLKGRRLAYYYSEDDEQEKGLIDISFHRVLPADHDKLTGLHATLTGASTTPTAPTHNHIQTSAEADAERDTTAASDSIFIFKLVPPRSGLSRAVTFTKPTVHYFAVPNIKQGRLWMAALMKATIDRDDTQAVTTSYQQKTISLAKARQMRHRPPALMNLEDKVDEDLPQVDSGHGVGGAAKGGGDDDADGKVSNGDDKAMTNTAAAASANARAHEMNNGLGISLNGEDDSGVSGLSQMGLHKVESARARGLGTGIGGQFMFADGVEGGLPVKSMPQSA